MIASVHNVLHQHVASIFVTRSVPVPIEVPQIDATIVIPIFCGLEEDVTLLGIT